jgi:hypothetical protein
MARLLQLASVTICGLSADGESSQQPPLQRSLEAPSLFSSTGTWPNAKATLRRSSLQMCIQPAGRRLCRFDCVRGVSPG